MISKHLTALSMILACSASVASVACGGSDDKPAASANDVTTTTSTTADPATAAPPAAAAGTPGSMDPNASTNGAAMTATAPAAAPAPAAPAVTLSDAQIAGVVAAANQGEIDAAKIAKSNSKNKDVKMFAGHMVTDHSEWAKQETALLKTKKMTMADSDLSTKLKGDATTLDASLKSTKGADFDKQYMDAQVKDHQAVLDTLDNTLIPQAQDADLKAMLTTVRGKVADHLKMAQDIQSKL